MTFAKACGFFARRSPHSLAGVIALVDEWFE